MSVELPDARREQVAVTRHKILDAAEKLFALHGIAAVSHRRIAATAKQGNNAVVGYYFGSKQNLVAAVEALHLPDIDDRRRRYLATASANDSLDAWVTRLVRPYTDHLAALPQPSSYARFSAKLLTEPGCNGVARNVGLRSSALSQTMAGITARLHNLQESTLLRRTAMATMLLTYTCADYESELCNTHPTPSTDWYTLGENIISALVGVWAAPPLPPAR